MPQSGTLPLKDAFTDDAPHTNTSRKDHHNDSSTNSGATGRARPKRDNDDETRPLFRNQFSQSSKMGSFALQRSDDQNSLRNLAETFDRKKQLLATTSASARDTLSTRNGNGLGRRDDRDITKDKERSELAPWERKDNFKSDRSNDWRRPGPSTQDGDDNGERRPLGRQDRNTDRDDDPRKDRSLRGRGRSPSQERSRWVDRRRSQSRRRDREEGDRPLLGRRAKDADTDGDRRVSGTRRLGRDNDRDRDTANSRSNRDSTRGDREPAWMGDYVPETSGKTGGSRANDSGVDDLQAWKRSIKEKELAVATSEDNAAPLPNGDLAPQPPPNDLDDLQLFKLKVKQEQEKRDTTSESEGVAAVAPLDPPPGLSATVDTSMTTQPSEHSQVISLSDVFPSHPNPIPKYQSLAAHQSPMSVAGIDGDVMAAHPHSSLGQSLQSQPTRDLSNKSLSQPLNGRLTPTSSASHVPSSSSSQYAGERTGSPSGPSSPASQAPKGSRFAKFWDKNKPGSDMGGSARDTTSASTPSPTGVNLSGGLGGTPTWAAGANIHPQDPRVGRSQSRSSSVASGGIPPNRLDGLLQQMNINDVPQQTVYPPANEHEAERMQNLLSMLTGSSVS
ncbi:hypothetical protein DL93DRAFT_1822212 [Clavulina sp. PMI_390]|nr:hypothetical protein DL93DRAFT_1822212 [Clavulina sp. PMI_390]